MSKTVLFQTIQFFISSQFSPIWLIDRTLSGATTLGQWICRDLPTNINRSDYLFALEKLHPGTAGNDEALFDPNWLLQLKKG